MRGTGHEAEKSAGNNKSSTGQHLADCLVGHSWARPSAISGCSTAFSLPSRVVQRLSLLARCKASFFPYYSNAIRFSAKSSHPSPNQCVPDAAGTCCTWTRAVTVCGRGVAVGGTGEWGEVVSQQRKEKKRHQQLLQAFNRCHALL